MGEQPKQPVAAGTRLSPPKAFTHFALLDHGLGNTDPGFWTADGASFDYFRQKMFDKVMRAQPQWKGLRIAMADLSGSTPALCGMQTPGDASVKKKGETITTMPRCLEMWEAASSSKVCLLYAAFQLKAEVIAMANANPAITPAELVDKLRIKWLASQVVDTKLPKTLLHEKGPKVELRGKEVLRDGKQIALVQNDGSPVGPPKLDRIFDISKPGGKWAIKFRGEPANWDTDDIVMNMLVTEVEDAHVYYKPLPAKTRITKKPFEFFEKLWLTIEVSHDFGADDVIDDIGFLYINSLLWQSGLFDAKRGAGMWVGRHYVSPKYWTAPPCPEVRTRDGQVVRAGMSAVAGVAFMTLLHKGKLVNAAESKRMKIFLSRVPPFETKDEPSMHGSPFTADLHRYSDVGGATVRVVHSFSKIGLGNFGNVFDIVLAEVYDKTAHATVTFAACMLDATLSDDVAEPAFEAVSEQYSVLKDGGLPLGTPAPMPPIPPIPEPPGDDDEDEVESEESDDA